MDTLPTIDINRVPRHIAIIMDGNGRWAKQRGLDRSRGHQQGVEAVKKITELCTRIGVKYLTLYTFSTENWNRPSQEVTALMGLVLTSLEEQIFMTNNVRFRMIGDKDRLPQAVRQKISDTEDHTRNNTRMTMVIAMSYSSRWEITRAVRELCELAKDGVIQPQHISEETVKAHLATSFMPDPDLMIRTGGEMRLSNYLLWQCAYSELYFTPVYWPDFGEKQLLQAIADYQHRERRYGLTSEQLTGSGEQTSDPADSPTDI